MAIQTQNPATGEILKTFKAHDDAYVDGAIARAVIAQKEVESWTFEQRGKTMENMAAILEDEAEAFAKIITLEMGKPYQQAIGEIKKCAWACRYYAENAQAHLQNEYIQSNAKTSYRAYFPLGVIMAIMPWNFPFWQAFRFTAPAIMAGNTCLLKHASNVPQCALAIEDIVKRAGFPDGALTTLLIGGPKVERVLRDKRVVAATLTGSEPAGASVAAICGSEIMPTVLELGGADAFIIMPSADIDKAAEIGSTSRLLNNGQSCIAAKRFFVHADIYDDVKAHLITRFKALKVGDPMLADTDIGPLVNEDSYKEITRQVKNALKAGAKHVFGGEALSGDGFYFKPGILEDIPPEAAAYHEEIFGPVILLFKICSLDEAINIANASPFGLGSAIWTQDKAEQEEAIRRLQAGATFVNSMTSSDPRLPFGGIKKSGYGRELAEEGVRTWSNVKTVSIA